MVDVPLGSLSGKVPANCWLGPLRAESRFARSAPLARQCDAKPAGSSLMHGGVDVHRARSRRPLVGVVGDT